MESQRPIQSGQVVFDEKIGKFVMKERALERTLTVQSIHANQETQLNLPTPKNTQNRKQSIKMVKTKIKPKVTSRLCTRLAIRHHRQLSEEASKALTQRTT